MTLPSFKSRTMNSSVASIKRKSRMASGQTFLLSLMAFCIASLCLQFANGDTLVGCNTTVIKVPNSNVQGGVGIDNAADVTSCEAICAGNSSCYGFDWDRLQNRCFLTGQRDAAIYYNNAQGVDHYILLKGPNNCYGSCSYSTWNPVINLHTSGAEGQSMSSLDQCILLCIRNASCLSIDWDPENPNGINCWIQSGSSNLADAKNVYHYDKSCSQITETSSTRTTKLPLPLSSTLSSSTTLPQPIVTSTTATTTASTRSSSSSSSSSSSTIKAVNASLSTTLSSSRVTISSTRPTILSTTGSTKLITYGTGTSNSSSALSSVNSVAAVTPSAIATSTRTNSSSFSATVPSQLDNDTWRTSQDSSSKMNIEGEYEHWLIKPTYVVLTGVGGGCLLLVLTAVVILCQYPLNSEKNPEYPYPSDTIDSSDVIDTNIFDTRSNDFPLNPVIATEFEAPIRR